MNEPALTAEEWGLWLSEGSYEIDGMLFRKDGDVVFPSEHGLAAAFLYGEPFGFTRGDVRYLRACADIVGEVQGGHYHTEEGELHRIADRIEALLPPEDK